MKKVGPYTVLEKLEQSSTLTLYTGVNENSRRTALIRVANAPDYNEQVVAKAKALGSVQHPAVAAVYEQGTQRDGLTLLAYFAVEHPKGERLESIMERHAEIPLKTKLELLVKLCEGVHALNGAGNVCLCTPDDVIVDNGSLKIIDVHADLPPDQSTTVRVMQRGMKRIPFWSPELITGAKVRDRREDVFALGLLTYVFVAGDDPYFAKNPIDRAEKVMGEQAAPLSSVAKNCPPQLEAAVKKALRKDPAQRQQSVRELAAELRLIAVGL